MKHKYQILLLLFVIILFSVLGSFSNYEGLSPQEQGVAITGGANGNLCENYDAAGNKIDAMGNRLNEDCTRMDTSCNYIDSFGYSRSREPSEVDGNCNLKTNPNKLETLIPRPTGITCDTTWDDKGNRTDNCGNIVDASCNRICNMYDTNNYRINEKGNLLDIHCQRIDTACNYINSEGYAMFWPSNQVDDNCRQISYPTPDVNDPNMHIDPPPNAGEQDSNWGSNWDDFILKSEIVPPVCPACPPFIDSCGASGGGLTGETGDDIAGETGTPYDGTIMNKNEESQSNQKNMNYSFKQTIETKNDDSNNGFGFPNLFNSNNDSKNQNNSNNQNEQNKQNYDSNELQPNSNSRLFNNFSDNEIDDYKNEIEELKEKLEQLKTFSGSCPPCPACERCPEPSFDCKKVPNYRSTSVGDYLPMPILNDFSRFS